MGVTRWVWQQGGQLPALFAHAAAVNHDRVRTVGGSVLTASMLNPTWLVAAAAAAAPYSTHTMHTGCYRLCAALRRGGVAACVVGDWLAQPVWVCQPSCSGHTTAPDPAPCTRLRVCAWLPHTATLVAACCCWRARRLDCRRWRVVLAAAVCRGVTLSTLDFKDPPAVAVRRQPPYRRRGHRTVSAAASPHSVAYSDTYSTLNGVAGLLYCYSAGATPRRPILRHTHPRTTARRTAAVPRHQ